jgi:hypothetical protein
MKQLVIKMQAHITLKMRARIPKGLAILTALGT